MALTKKKTRADKVASNSDRFPVAEPQGTVAWKPPTPGAFGRTPNLGGPEADKWHSLGRKVQAGARLRPRTNSETYTGKRVNYTSYISKKKTPVATVSAKSGGKKK